MSKKLTRNACTSSSASHHWHLTPSFAEVVLDARLVGVVGRYSYFVPAGGASTTFIGMRDSTYLRSSGSRLPALGIVREPKPPRLSSGKRNMFRNVDGPLPTACGCKALTVPTPCAPNRSLIEAGLHLTTRRIVSRVALLLELQSHWSLHTPVTL